MTNQLTPINLQEISVHDLPSSTRSPDEIAAFQERLAQLDLEPIIYKLVKPEEGEGWTLQKADTIAELYRVFLLLNYLYPQQSIVPTKDIDEVWHKHILDTGKYRDDCQYLFGYFLDHFPYFGIRSEEDAIALENAFAKTKLLFARHYKAPNDEFFSACGSSCGQTLCDNNSCNSNSCKPSTVAVDIRPRLDRTAMRV